MNRKRVSTGIKGLDEVLGGGYPENSLNVIMGAPGTGKTILAEQLVFANATKERPALYLTTYSEPLEKLILNTRGTPSLMRERWGSRFSMRISPSESGRKDIRPYRI